MGASDVTTDVPEAEVVGDDQPSPANGANGHVAKKRKKQKALAGVAANGHAGKVDKRKSVRTAEEGDGPAADGDRDALAATNGAVVTDDRALELPVVEDLDEVGDDLDAVAVEDVDEVGEDRDAVAEPKLRRRAAKRAAAARRSTPAGRRAELVATAASIAAASAEARPASSSGRVGKVVRRLVALIAIVMVPGAVYALVVTDGPVKALPRADAAYLSEQLITADQRVRKQLVRLRPLHTSAAIARTRESQLTARSIALEIGDHGGAAAERLLRAAKLEARWLDAVGSTLSNPRSPLRDQLVARDAALRPALAALPSTDGLRRKGGAKNLRHFAKSRIAAKRHHRR